MFAARSSQAARVRWAVARKDADISISPWHKENTEAGEYAGQTWEKAGATWKNHPFTPLKLPLAGGVASRIRYNIER